MGRNKVNKLEKKVTAGVFVPLKVIASFADANAIEKNEAEFKEIVKIGRKICAKIGEDAIMKAYTKIKK